MFARRTLQLSLGALLLGLCVQGCFSVSSRRHRFVDKIVHSNSTLLQERKHTLLGKPQGKVTGSIAIPRGRHVIVRIAYPKYRGYCERLKVHVPRAKTEQGHYRVWLSAQATGPWSPVGRGSGTKSFNVDSTPFYHARFVKIEGHSLGPESVYIDTVVMRVHLDKWVPYRLRKAQRQRTQVQKVERSLALYREAQRQYQAKEYKATANTLLKALPLTPNDPRLYYLLGASYRGLESVYQGLRYYRYALQLKPPAPADLQELGELYLMMYLPTPAFRHLKRCVDTYTLYTGCYEQLTRAAGMLKKKYHFTMYRDQYLIVRKRTHVELRRWSMKQFFARLFRRPPAIQQVPHLFDYPFHLNWFRFLVRLFPTNRQELLARSIEDLERRRKAINTLKDDGRARYFKAKLYQLGAAHQQAIQLLTKLSREIKDPDFGTKVYIAWGQNLQALKRPDRAREVYQQGIKRFKDSVVARSLLTQQIHELTAKPKIRKAPPQRR